MVITMSRSLHALMFDADAARLGFAFAELELGVTFCHITMQTSYLEVAQRNLARTKHILDAASRLLPDLRLTGMQVTHLEELMTRLQRTLMQAEEYVADSFPQCECIAFTPSEPELPPSQRTHRRQERRARRK